MLTLKCQLITLPQTIQINFLSNHNSKVPADLQTGQEYLPSHREPPRGSRVQGDRSGGLGLQPLLDGVACQAPVPCLHAVFSKGQSLSKVGVDNDYVNGGGDDDDAADSDSIVHSYYNEMS